MGTAAGVRFDRLCRAAGLPMPVPEFQFAIHRGRKWAFDWAWPDRRLALEVDGGVWNIGRHQRADGFRKDREKLNCAVLEGWAVLHCEPSDLGTAPLFDMVRAALAQRRKD